MMLWLWLLRFAVGKGNSQGAGPVGQEQELKHKSASGPCWVPGTRVATACPTYCVSHTERCIDRQ